MYKNVVSNLDVKRVYDDNNDESLIEQPINARSGQSCSLRTTLGRA